MSVPERWAGTPRRRTPVPAVQGWPHRTDPGAVSGPRQLIPKEKSRTHATRRHTPTGIRVCIFGVRSYPAEWRPQAQEADLHSFRRVTAVPAARWWTCVAYAADQAVISFREQA